MANQTIRTTAVNDYNVAVTQQSGRVGNVRYIQRNGMTYVRSASNSVVNNARTDAQMEQRMKFASLSALYSLFGTYLHTAFQNKARNQSDFNAFMKMNQGEGAYMSKDEKASGMVIPLPVFVSQGTLSGTCTELSGTDIKTDIAVPTGAQIATVGALTNAIITSNPDWKAGDQLTILELIQNGSRVIAKFGRIILKTAGTDTTDSRLKVSGTNLVVKPSTNSLGIAIIHTNATRKSSTSSIVLTSAGAEIYEEYTSEDQYDIARSSYGEAESRYLRAGEASTGGGSTSTKVLISTEVNPEGTGTVTGGGKKEIGSEVTLVATPADGYQFQKWSDGVTTATRTITVTEAKTYKAIFMVAD